MSACYQCGASLSAESDICAVCGMAAIPADGSAAAAPPPPTPPSAAPLAPPTVMPPPSAAAPPTGAFATIATMPPPAPTWAPAAAGPQLSAPSVGSMNARVRRPSRRTWLILGLVVVLLAGGAGGFVVFKALAPDGGDAVQEYFDDLAKGDTAAALKLVDRAGDYSASQEPLLHDKKVLADKANRPTNLKVVTRGKEKQPIKTETTQEITVTYQIGGKTLRYSITAVKRDSTGRYELQMPFMHLDIDSPGGRTLTVNGKRVSMDASTYSTSLLVFPGRYAATAAGNALLGAQTVTASATQSSDRLPEYSVEFDTPQLASGATDALTKQINAKLDECVQSTETAPSGCPFDISYYDYYDNVSVVWSITSYPTYDFEVSSEPSSEAQVDISSNQYGVAHYTVTYDDGSGDKQKDSDSTYFSVYGTASASGSTINLNLSSY